MLCVSAGIVCREGKVLLCQRAQKGAHGGLWEFPGGKQRQGETPAQCLVRECREELGISLRVGALVKAFVWQSPDRSIRFSFFLASIAQGEPICLEHQAIEWVLPRMIPSYQMCPADALVLDSVIGMLCGHCDR